MQSKKCSLNKLIIHTALEPGVIDNAMLTRCILQNGPKGEAGRLFKEEGVRLDEASIVRLEFQNILRIDHLWMLKSLTKLILAHNYIEKIENLETLTGLRELDLSFNCIEKIENLDALVNIETLTLFHNKIKKLENMETLQKLLIFSIGENLIEDYKEMSYLGQFRMLRSVSIKGNPCCEDPMAYIFIKAALVRVTYLDYKLIKEEERKAGLAFFRGALRKLEEEFEASEKRRIAQEEFDAKVEFYALSFVEYLSGPELFETMFKKDPDGTQLLLIGGELLYLYEEYKTEYVATMEELVEYAQEAHNIRLNEIKLFKDLIDSALEESVRKSRIILEEYQTRKKPLVEKMQDLISKFTAKQATMEELEPSVIETGEAFNDAIYDLWKQLMTIELNLFEQCEESRIQFAVNITEMITKLQEVARNAFGLWRDREGLWAGKQENALLKLYGNEILLGNLPSNLFQMMMDDIGLMRSMVAASTDNHTRFIDAREDLLATRANKWKDDLVQGINDNEIKRNRDRILEIYFYIDNQRAEWSEMQFIEAMDPETAAFLGDNY